MRKISPKRTLNPESCEKVVEQKSLESREKVAEPEQKPEVSPEKHKSSYKGYTSARATANREWEKQQARINLRMAPDLKTILDTHAKSRGESTMGFIIRAIKEQIKRDNAE